MPNEACASNAGARFAPGLAAHLVVIADHTIDFGHLGEQSGAGSAPHSRSPRSAPVGRSRFNRRIDCRACATASLVTAQLFDDDGLGESGALRLAQNHFDSKALRRQPKVTTSTLTV